MRLRAGMRVSGRPHAGQCGYGRGACAPGSAAGMRLRAGCVWAGSRAPGGAVAGGVRVRGDVRGRCGWDAVAGRLCVWAGGRAPSHAVTGQPAQRACVGRKRA